MTITLEQAQAILRLRDRSFVECDMDAYLSIWAEHCTVEGPTHRIEGRENLRRVIDAAWSIQRPIHMSTRSIGVAADTMFHEFTLVWEHRESGDRALQTGSTVSGVDSAGRWSWLREYFDPADTCRASAATQPAVRDLLTGAAAGSLQPEISRRPPRGSTS